MSAPRHRVLFVSGFPRDIRAKDLAVEFERYGRLTRCDIPVSSHVNAIPYAFVEYRESHDAEEACDKMQGAVIDGARIIVDWARRTPSNHWRPDGPPTSGGRYDRDEYRGYRGNYERSSEYRDFRPRDYHTNRDDYRNYRRGEDREFYPASQATRDDGQDRQEPDDRGRRYRSRSPRRRDSGYVDTTRETRERHSSGYSQEYKDRDSRHARDEERSYGKDHQYREEERQREHRSDSQEREHTRHGEQARHHTPPMGIRPAGNPHHGQTRAKTP